MIDYVPYNEIYELSNSKLHTKLGFLDHKKDGGSIQRRAFYIVAFWYQKGFVKTKDVGTKMIYLWQGCETRK